MDNPSHGPCPQRAQKVEGHRFEIRIAAGHSEYDDLLSAMKFLWPGMIGYVTERRDLRLVSKMRKAIMQLERREEEKTGITGKTCFWLHSLAVV